MYHTGLCPFPCRVNVDLTDRCNFRCPTCSKWRDLSEGPELSTAEWDDVFQRLANRVPTSRMTFTGGEPCLRDDLIPLVRNAKRAGFRLTVITNGSLLNAAIVGNLERAGLDNLVISLNGIREETHDSSRGFSGSFRRIMSLLPDLRPVRLRVQIEAIILATNIEELVPLLELSMRHGLDGISYQVLADQRVHFALAGRRMPAIDADWFTRDPLWPTDLARVRNVLRELRARKSAGQPVRNLDAHLCQMEDYFTAPERTPARPCLSGVSHLYIDPRGDARLCYGSEPIGNVREIHPITLWRSIAARLQRRNVKRCHRTCRILNNNL